MAAHAARTHLLTAKKQKTKTGPHKLKSLPVGKWRFREKEVSRMGQKQKRIRQKSNRTRQKNKNGDMEKWDQNDSPEIPDTMH